MTVTTVRSQPRIQNHKGIIGKLKLGKAAGAHGSYVFASAVISSTLRRVTTSV